MFKGSGNEKTKNHRQISNLASVFREALSLEDGSVKSLLEYETWGERTLEKCIPPDDVSIIAEINPDCILGVTYQLNIMI